MLWLAVVILLALWALGLATSYNGQWPDSPVAGGRDPRGAGSGISRAQAGIGRVTESTFGK